MLPNLIVTDPDLLENGHPKKGADIHADHIRCHPKSLETVENGLFQMTGKKLTVLTKEEYLNAIKP